MNTVDKLDAAELDRSAYLSVSGWHLYIGYSEPPDPVGLNRLLRMSPASATLFLPEMPRPEAIDRLCKADFPVSLDVGTRSGLPAPVEGLPVR